LIKKVKKSLPIKSDQKEVGKPWFWVWEGPMLREGETSLSGKMGNLERKKPNKINERDEGDEGDFK